MAVGVIMPALEMAQDTGTLLSWFKKEGDRVAKGERLLQVETDKAVVEIEAASDGILAGVAAREGDVVPVGRTIAWLVQPGEKPPEPAPEIFRPAPRPLPAGSTAHGADAAPADRVRMSPKARRLARELGLDAAGITGSGPGGEVLAEDVQAAAASERAPMTAAASASATERGPSLLPSSIHRRMAERTTRSWTTTPHFYVTRDVEAGPLGAERDRWLQQIERSHAVKVTHTDLLVAAVARVLRRHPRVNASWTGDAVVFNQDVNIALAIAVDEAVVTAVVRNADTKSIGAIASARRELVERARTGRLQPADVSGATFTISNLGMFGVDAFTAVIVPPQAAILAVGAIADRVVPDKGQVIVRPMMTLTLGCDHRVMDGARAAAFLRDLAVAVSEPGRWLN
jgi:pyruvate dehydrogenase E2 component (dihydrolipoamide acetyltransferase)